MMTTWALPLLWNFAQKNPNVSQAKHIFAPKTSVVLRQRIFSNKSIMILNKVFFFQYQICIIILSKIFYKMKFKENFRIDNIDIKQGGFNFKTFVSSKAAFNHDCVLGWAERNQLLNFKLILTPQLWVIIQRL